MAVLIDMEMPDTCFLCRFCRRQEYGEYFGEDTAWECVASKKRITDGQDLIAIFKHPDCPLMKVAEAPDAVSRHVAIDAALTFLVEYCGAAFDEDMQKMLCERINALPSA